MAVTASPALTLKRSAITTSKPALATPKTARLPEISKAEKDRMKRLQAARKAYAGDWSGKMPLKIEKNEPDDNTLLNRCSPIVDKDVSWLAKGGMKIKVMAANNTTEAPAAAKDYLFAALDCTEDDLDGFLTLFTEIVQAGAISGHPFVKLIPGKGGVLPRIIVLDSGNCWVDADPEDINTARQFNIQYDWWNMKAGTVWEKRQVICSNKGEDNDVDDDQYAPNYDPDYADPDAVKWTICTYVREKPTGPISTSQRDSGWVQQGAEEDWPYTWSPIHACKNLPSECNYYGAPSLTPDIIHLNEVINRNLSYATKIARIYGHPWIWTAGVNARDIEVTPGRIICLPGDDHKLSVAEAHGDLPNILAYVNSLMLSMDELSRTPAVALGRMVEIPRQPSSFSTKLLFMPHIEKTEHQRRLYGPLVIQLCEHILEMGSFKGLHVQVEWPNLLPDDDLQMAQMALTFQQLGSVSMNTILDMVGLNYEEENELLQGEQVEKQKQIQAGLQAAGLPSDLPSMVGNPMQPAGAGQPGGSPPVNPQAAAQGQALSRHPAAVAQQQLLSKTKKSIN
jgi:hypothetical protein